VAVPTAAQNAERCRSRRPPPHNPPLERTAAAVYFTCGRASRVRRRVRSTAFRYAPRASRAELCHPIEESRGATAAALDVPCAPPDDRNPTLNGRARSG
jgi:hypothetical protein